MREGVQQELASEGAPAYPHRREAVRLRVEPVRVEVRQVGRADATLQEAHGGETVRVRPLREGVCAKRSPVSALEEA